MVQLPISYWKNRSSTLGTGSYNLSFREFRQALSPYWGQLGSTNYPNTGSFSSNHTLTLTISGSDITTGAGSETYEITDIQDIEQAFTLNKACDVTITITSNTKNLAFEYLTLTKTVPAATQETNSWASNYRYGFNGKEKENNLYNSSNAYDFGARLYDSRLGRWFGVDPLAIEYPNISPYVAVANNPFIFVDPDGKRLYFVGGAGNDSKGWNYIQRFKNIFTKLGIKGFTPINATSGTNGDIMFTTLQKNYSEQYYTLDFSWDEGFSIKLKRVQDPAVYLAVGRILEDRENRPLKEGEQLNLAGYSYGSVLQAHVALELADQGIVVDNLVLIGSPIGSNSALYKQLLEHKNIKNIIRYDIPNDLLSNPPDELQFIRGAKQNFDINDKGIGPHFDLARPGLAADECIEECGKTLIKGGVR